MLRKALRQGALILTVSTLFGTIAPVTPAAAQTAAMPVPVPKSASTAALNFVGRFDNHGWASGTGIHLQPTSSSPLLTIITPGDTVVDFCFRLGQTLHNKAGRHVLRRVDE